MNTDDIYFKVSYSGRVDGSLRAAADRAEPVGSLVEVRDAIQLLGNWLRADPETLGEPYRIYRSQELTEYIGFVGPLVVRYNIHHASKHVFVVYPIRVARWARF